MRPLLAFAALLLLLAPQAHADGAPPSSWKLPRSIFGAAAVVVGTDAYLFGGEWCTKDPCAEAGYFPPGSEPSASVLRVDLDDGTVAAAGTLPKDVVFAGAALLDGVAYLAGGRLCGGALYCDDIVAYDPATGAATTLAARLPMPTGYVGAAASGDAVYLFGGYGCLDAECASRGASDSIHRLDPAARTLTLLPARLPTPRHSFATVTDGASAWLLGGEDDAGGLLDEVLRYDFATGALATLPGRLPVPIMDAAGAMLGGDVYLFGGDAGTAPTDAIVRVDPATGAATAMAGTLPSPRESAAAVALPGAAFVLGGDWWYGAGGMARACCDDVVRYSLDVPSAPRDAVAASGPGRGEVRLSWSPPASAGTAGAVASYRVYGGPDGASLALLATVPATQTSHDETGLGDGVRRVYRVSAVSPAGEGSWSPSVLGWTHDRPVAPVAQARPGPAPGEITLSWTASFNPLPVTYRVFRATEPGAEVLVAEGLEGTTFVDATCPFGRPCYYQVSAENLVGEGPRSYEVAAVGTQLRPALGASGEPPAYNDADADGEADPEETSPYVPPLRVASCRERPDDPCTTSAPIVPEASPGPFVYLGARGFANSTVGFLFILQDNAFGDHVGGPTWQTFLFLTAPEGPVGGPVVGALRAADAPYAAAHAEAARAGGYARYVAIDHTDEALVAACAAGATQLVSGCHPPGRDAWLLP